MIRAHVQAMNLQGIDWWFHRGMLPPQRYKLGGLFQWRRFLQRVSISV